MRVRNNYVIRIGLGEKRDAHIISGDLPGKHPVYKQHSFKIIIWLRKQQRALLPTTRSLLVILLSVLRSTQISFINLESGDRVTLVMAADRTAVVAAGGSILGEHDVLTILNQLTNVAPQWELLAVCLRLSPSEIANIRSKYSENVNLALSEVILRWLAKSPQDQLTWSGLIEALRQPILNEERTASQIEQKFIHCSHKPTQCKL